MQMSSKKSLEILTKNKKYRKKFLKLSAVIYFITKVLKLYLDVVFFTSKVQIDIDKDAEDMLLSKKVFFLTLWHGRILIFPKILAKYSNLKVLTSLHSDGRYIDRFVNLYDRQTIRGSTDKGGVSAIKNIVRSIKQDRMVITPDGPRGPKYKINSAVTHIAAKFHVPVIYLSFSSTKVKILNTWDKFMIPLPFTKIFVNISAPVYFKKRDDVKLERLMLQQTKDLDKKCTL
jgi:lysophospholipid acyltransferase (LPLAT)-like uncharacterized protein